MKYRQATFEGKLLKAIPRKQLSLLSMVSELEDALPLLEQGYKIVKIPKKRGRLRTIHVPCSELKKIQYRILRFIKTLETAHDSPIYGLCKGHGSYLDHAREHAESRFFLKLDLEDAFSSVSYHHLKPILFEAISNKIEREIRHYVIDQIDEIEEFYNDLEEYISSYMPETRRLANKLTKLILKLTMVDNRLPQGTPTSPMLFYLFMSEKWPILDRIISRKLYKMKVKGLGQAGLSLYVDNIVFSTKKDWPIAPDIAESIIQEIENYAGLSLNHEKTKMADSRNGAIIITGLMVDGKGNVSVPRQKRENIRATIHNACFVPLDPALDSRIEGLMSFLKFVYNDKIPKRISCPYNRYRKHRNTQKLALSNESL